MGAKPRITAVLRLQPDKTRSEPYVVLEVTGAPDIVGTVVEQAVISVEAELAKGDEVTEGLVEAVIHCGSTCSSIDEPRSCELPEHGPEVRHRRTLQSGARWTWDDHTPGSMR